MTLLTETRSSTPGALPREYALLTTRLDSAENAFRAAALLRGLAVFAAVVVPGTAALLLIAGLAAPPAAVNFALIAAWLVLLAIAYVKTLHRPLLHRPSYAEIARLVEEHAPASERTGDLHNQLINAVLLAEEPRRHPWTADLLREAYARTAHLPLEKAVPWRQPRNAWLAAAGVLLVCTGAVALWPNIFRHGLAVLTHPAQFVPQQGRVQIVAVSPGNDTALAGQSLLFTATVLSPDHKTVPTTLTLHYASGKTQTLPMTPFGADNTQYTRQGVLAAENLDYFITAGDSQSERFRITVLPQIHLAGFDLVATPPAYIGSEHRNLSAPRTAAGTTPTSAPANRVQLTAFDAPQGSTISLAVTLDAPAHEVLLDAQGAAAMPPVPLAKASDGRTFTLTFPLKESMRFTLRVNDANNRTLRQFPAGVDAAAGAIATPDAAYTLTSTPDAPPAVTAAEPGRDTDAKPGDKLALAATATDDYGLTAIRLEIAKNEAKEFTPAKDWPLSPKDGKPVRTATVRHTLDFPAGEYRLGDTLRYRFVAVDNRDLKTLDPGLAAQSAAGQVFTVHFNDTAAQAAASAKRWEELRDKLAALLGRQVALRKSAQALVPALSLEDLRKIATPLSDGQKSLRTDIAALGQDFPFEPSMKLIQKSLQVLAVEDATFAMDRTADLLLLSDSRTLSPLAIKLRQHQGRIIDVLQTLLAMAEAEGDRIAKKGENREGGELPADAREAWKKLAEDLKEFQKEQRAVIDATADLAKKPKDGFGPEDDKKLGELALQQDKWDKFLSDRLADMSKIAEQDLANASLLEELVQMKVELATAKDALNAKALEIATPLEENGLESAAQLTAHLERWLSHQPDRTNWQMEEPLTQNDQHMAELPKQLQDMVGDLMDKEEDLTEEMESLASKWADSLDKGAGWDTADGPMSNMSAQGVTGNQMPKNMEIQGRSGEDREGRSSGEMVGSTAEGKEGRRTPTRLTNDPFSNSKVDDQSKLGAGGATGGGKKGGLGSEGLEGPAPQDQQQITQRLAGQQAALRNEAERLALQMHAARFDNFKLLESNAYLKKSEDALKQYHYQTALYYQGQAVESLNTAKVLASGHLHVVADTSPTADTKTQKDISAALNGPLPKGYADPVKAYFEKLAAPEK
jgi:hypothetical protein